jgi:polar amino acid transport system permease protein
MALQVERNPIQHENDTYVAPPEALDEDARPAPRQTTWVHVFFGIPWWLIIIVGTMVILLFVIANDEVNARIFSQLDDGVVMTLRVSFISYVLALIIGAILGIIRSSVPTPGHGIIGGTLSLIHFFFYNAATIFVEVLRGLPVLVVLLMGAFVITPAIRTAIQDNIDPDFMIRGQSVETAIMVLSLAYGAFLSEVFRSGIQSIDKGQIEAAKSLGMSSWQTMRLIIMPQAIRRILPPLGNDFIAMIKDSSLVTVIAVQDVTHIAKKTVGANFLVLNTYLIVAIIYLMMTFIGSLLVRETERYLDGNNKHSVLRIFGRIGTALRDGATIKQKQPTE